MCGAKGMAVQWVSCPFIFTILGRCAHPSLWILLGEQRLNVGDKTVSWQAAADVAISFQPGHEKQRPWTEAETPEQHGFRCGYTECHRGVFLNIRSGAQ